MSNARPEEIADVVRARRIELIGVDGQVRAVIKEESDAQDDSCPSVTVGLLDRDGRERLGLALTGAGATISFARAGNDRLVLGVDDPPEASVPGAYLVLCDARGVPVLGWRVDDDGSSKTYGAAD